MKKNICLAMLITGMIATNLMGCKTLDAGPGPQGPIGPQDSISPDAIVIENTGRVVSQEHPYTGFEEIEVNSLLEVEISQGEGYQIITEVEEAALPYLEVSLEGGRLRIGLDPSQGYHTKQATLQARITLPAITALIVDGVSQVTLQDMHCSGAVDLTVRGVSTLDGRISGCDLQIEVSDTSTVELEGSAQQVTVQVTGVSVVDLSGFEIEDLSSDKDQTSQLILQDD